MALVDFQTALGRLVRTPQDSHPFRSLHLLDNERSCVEVLTHNRGFQFTVDVQHSWCIGRAKKTGGLTLSILPPDDRKQLLEAWTRAGGGTSSFFAAEADAFLEFVACRLSDPSHELSICRFEQATLRANDGQSTFSTSQSPPDSARSSLRRGRHAALVFFHGKPDEIMGALSNERPLPPMSAEVKAAMLFAPGIEQLCRPASSGEIAIWQRLATPAELTELCREGHRREDVEAMHFAGVVECEA